MKKRLFSLLLICMVIISPVTTFAKSTTIRTEVIPQQVRDADIERQINEILIEKREQDNGIIQPMAGDHIYTSEIVATKYKIVEGFAGGQPTGGDRFPGGGGFTYSPSGGPSASANVSFSVPYKLVTISANLGTATPTTVGNYYEVPNRTQYFKLYVQNNMQVNQVNIYKQITAGSPKTLESINYITTLYSRVAFPVAM